MTRWSNNRNRPEALLQEVRGAGARAEAMELDLSLPESPDRLLDAATQRLEAPSIFVNNATYSIWDGFEELDAVTLDAHYVFNLRATALLSVGFARRFEGEHGRIINLTSGHSLGPMPGELS